MWEESEMPLDAIDMDNLSKYLGMKLSKAEIAEEGIEDLVYTKKVVEKKKKISKKVSQKHLIKKTKTKRQRIQKDKENEEISCSEGPDTLEATTERTSEENNETLELNTNSSGGADTPDTTVKKKRKKVEWIKPARKPSEKEGRQMFGIALEMMLRKCMENHLYQFDNEIRLQNK